MSQKLNHDAQLVSRGLEASGTNGLMPREIFDPLVVYHWSERFKKFVHADELSGRRMLELGACLFLYLKGRLAFPKSRHPKNRQSAVPSSMLMILSF